MSVICHTVTRGCFWSFCTDQWSLYVNCEVASLTFFFAFFLQEKKKTSPCLPQSSSAHHQPQVVEVVKIPGNQSVKYKSLTTELPKCQISDYEKPCVAHKLHCLPHSSTLRDGGGDLKSGKQLEEICARSQISFCFNPWQSSFTGMVKERMEERQLTETRLCLDLDWSSTLIGAEHFSLFFVVMLPYPSSLSKG